MRDSSRRTKAAVASGTRPTGHQPRATRKATDKQHATSGSSCCSNSPTNTAVVASTTAAQRSMHVLRDHLTTIIGWLPSLFSKTQTTDGKNSTLNFTHGSGTRPSPALTSYSFTSEAQHYLLPRGGHDEHVAKRVRGTAESGVSVCHAVKSRFRRLSHLRPRPSLAFNTGR